MVPVRVTGRNAVARIVLGNVQLDTLLSLRFVYSHLTLFLAARKPREACLFCVKRMMGFKRACYCQAGTISSECAWVSTCMGVYRFVCGCPFVEGEQTGKTSVCACVCVCVRVGFFQHGDLLLK